MAEKRSKNGNDSGRDSKGRFVVGNRGGGRPKIPDEVREMLKTATPKAVRLLIGMVDNEDAAPALRMDAAKTILDRVYGKATQPIDGSLDTVVQIVMDDETRELMG